MAASTITGSAIAGIGGWSGAAASVGRRLITEPHRRPTFRRQRDQRREVHSPWEQKDNPDGVANPADPRDVDNLYNWPGDPNSISPDLPNLDGFLASLNNCVSDGASVSGGFAGHCNWRLPNILELIGILDITQEGCVGGTGACIDPAFGPTKTSVYWSGTAYAGDASQVWYVDFFETGVGGTGIVYYMGKESSACVRAVRGAL